MEIAKSADPQPDTVAEHIQLEKLERLEQEYLRLTQTQNSAEVHKEAQCLHRKMARSVCKCSKAVCSFALFLSAEDSAAGEETARGGAPQEADPG